MSAGKALMKRNITFFPAYVFQSDCFLCLNEGDKLVIGGQEFENGTVLEGLSQNREYEFTLYHEGGLQNTGKVVMMQSAKLATLFVDTVSGDMEMFHQDKAYRESGIYYLVTADGKKNAGGELSYIAR